MNAPSLRQVASPTAPAASGRLVSLLDPQPWQISIRDIAHHLALQARWSGATAAPYSVAQHSVMVAELLPADHRLRAYGLLHDAHEAWTGDISSPMKRMLAIETEDRALGAPILDGNGERPLDAIAERLDKAIRAACGLEPPRYLDEEAIKAADDLAAWAEARDLLHPAIAAEYHRIMPRGAGPLPGLIKPWPWPEAEERFLQAAARYLPHCPE